MTAVDSSRIARGATGLLRAFNEAGVLDLADVHVAARVATLAGEPDEAVRLALALTVRALRQGSVCVDLSTVSGTVLGDADEIVDVTGLPWPEPAAWTAACAASPLVAEGDADDDAGGFGVAARPLRLAGGLLYLDRYWRQEQQVRAVLRERAAADPPEVDLDRLRAGLTRLFLGRDGEPSPPPDRQRLAAAVAVLRRVSVVAGGPGTGKTTTVARLLALLHDQRVEGGPAPRIALAAPTGKAAARLTEAVRTAALPPADRARIGELEATTLHRLLGVLPGSRNRFRHDRHHRLPFDVVVVDETSMVSLTLMARLLDAVAPEARLVLVGDPDQLASVEAGAVLGDLVRAPGGPEPVLQQRLEALVPADLNRDEIVHGVVELRRTYRFEGDSPLDRLARAIQAGDDDAAVAALRAGDGDLVFLDADPASPARGALDGLRRDVVAAAELLAAAARDGDVAAAVAGLQVHRLLCAHRHGPYGVHRWTEQIERWLAGAVEGFPARPDEGERYPGQPLLVTANDYETGLYNGDSGVVVRDAAGELRAAFARGGEPMLVAPGRLGAVQTMHAMTVHRAQGSQFERVSLVLPPAESPLLTRELLYTAVTRAERGVRVAGTEAAVRAAVRRPITRASGLRGRLAG